MPKVLEPDLQAIRASVALIGRLSDGLIRVGPLSLGLEGVLSWIPGLGELYGSGAAAFLLIQGARARVPASTLLAAAALMGGRTLISAIPIAGAAASDLLTAHKWSARMIVAAIDRRLTADADGGPHARGWSTVYA
jgi:ethanolamine transporter EutH